MRYALIIAGGSGTRLWPMSRQQLPKQLIPFIEGSSLLKIAYDRLDGLIDLDCRYICAGQSHRDPITEALPTLDANRFIGEPMGRDTLNAVGLGTAVISQSDPDAIVGVFTADHVIRPIDQFCKILEQGYQLAQDQPNTLVTFGITPTHPATAYGYLQLGDPVDGPSGARVVSQFKEKPDQKTAQKYFADGPDRYLWNSGMFVWRASTLLDCIKRYKPDVHAGLMKIAQAWHTDQRDDVLTQVYPTLEKISIDFAVMEPASSDPSVQVAAVPMPLQWLDVGSWPAFAKTCQCDNHENALAVQKHITIDTRNTLLASSDPDHLIAAVGCENLIIVHTPGATLVCRADRAEDIKTVHKMVGEKFGDAML